MTDKILALIALLFFVTVISVVPYFVPDIDLIIVTVFAAAMATFDFWRELFQSKNGD